MKLPPWTDKRLIAGVLIELAAVLLYTPITRYFYYGGGWPLVPLLFLIVYCIGRAYIFRSRASLRLKLLLVFWWTIYVAIRLAAVFFEK